MARTVRSQRVSRGTPRKFVWARSTGSVSLGPDAISRGNALADFETVYGAQLVGATVMRIRGVIFTQTTDATEAFQWMRFGAIVVPNPAAAVVAGDGPFGNDYADWFMFEPFVVSGAGNVALEGSGRVIDVKSSRKLDELGMSLFFYQQTSALNAGTMQLSWDLSIGLKLP